ncbi:MAG: putative alcohol dehydrogenase [Actinomycetota bacterium]|jgi:threonine dehydrogenase-like Zn-dependent dehydrogenase
MKATVLYGPGDVRVEEMTAPTVQASTDVVLKVILACICGSDLWDYIESPKREIGRPRGHEFIGVVDSIGSDVKHFAVGDLVVSPFVASCGKCDYCQKKQFTSCREIAFFGHEGEAGGQSEKVRVPHADGTLVKLPVELDSPLLPSLLTLSDVMCTGHHAAVTAKVKAGETAVVIGDGAVGLCAVIAAKRLGADRIILMGRHEARTKLGVEFGATDVVSERDEAGIEKVRALLNGDGAESVLECVGTASSMKMALGVVKDFGTIGRVGAAQYSEIPFGFGSLMANVTISGGVAPARAYIDELMPDILSGKINPGKVFDLTVSLDEAPAGYEAMANRTHLKVLVKP